MFAVPGWAVSPNSLVEQKSTATSSNSKKRKRQHEGENGRQKLSGSELGNLWDQSFGSHEKPSKKTNKQTTEKSQQAEDVVRAPETESKPKRLPTKLENTNVRHGKPDQNTRPEQKKSTLEKDKPSQPPNSPGATQLSLMKKLKNGRMTDEKKPSAETPSALTTTIPPLPNLPPTAALTPLQTKMRTKLTSARFRYLNQTLYTSSSSDALELFKASPDLFAEYHNGFSQQVKDSWPKNPVTEYIQSIKQRGISDSQNGLPRRKTGSCTIADLGCGDGPLARGCQSQIKALKLKFHSFDLHAPNSHVTVADISNLPLRDGEADIAIFCLSLMGTNWISFVEEAWRILRGGGKGEVWVAEVKSRFGRVKRSKVVENSVGKKRKQPKKSKTGDDGPDMVNGQELFAENETANNQVIDETDISAFTKVFQRRGFMLQEGSVSKSNKMFVSMRFVKSGIPTAGKHKGLRWNGKEYQKTHDGRMRFTSSEHQDEQDILPEEEAKVLKPCVYKTR